jgi:hypothetical protein
MQPPHPCEPLEKLVDRLNEQLDALCSQNREHAFLESLIDIRSLTDMTRAMLKDTEMKLANCRRHQGPLPNRPFLVTFPDPNRRRRNMETHDSQARTMLCKWVTACAGLGVLALSLGYGLHEDRVTQGLAAQNEQEFAFLNATRNQVDSLTATVNALALRPELPPAPTADATMVHQTASNRQESPVHPQRKITEQKGSDLSVTNGGLKNVHTELTDSSAWLPNELTILQSKGEHSYYEFDIDKSKQFQKEGPLGIRLKKANTKQHYADLELMFEDQNLSQKHVNLYQTVMFYGSDSSQFVEVVINNISKDHIHGYVRAPEYRQSGLASRSSNIPNPAPQARSVGSERQRAAVHWHGFSVNKIISRVRLRSDI